MSQGTETQRKVYSGSDLAAVIPTKDRPNGVRELLQSLAFQTQRPGRVILVDGGQSVESIVNEFKSSLNIEYYACQPPGQIRQRLMGIEKLNDKTPLVAFLDDEVVFEKETIKKI